MFETVLVANRGGVAARIIDTCRRMGIKSVAVYSDVDTDAVHVHRADESVLLGPAPLEESYLDPARLIEAARVTGAEAIHPGAGVLAVDVATAARVRDAGLAWIGPTSDALTVLTDTAAVREAAAAAGVPLAPEPADGSADAPGRVRRIDVALLGLADHRIVAVGERDSSLRLRLKNLVDDAPAPGIDADLRRRLRRAAAQVAETVDYRGLGTVEFLLDRDTGAVGFRGLVPRLQVGHPVTELVTGIDLIEQQLLIAAGAAPSFDVDEPVEPHGHAVGVRVHAEDLDRVGPGSGRIGAWQMPGGEGIRVESGYREGDTVTRHYDPLLAVLAAWGTDRSAALDRLRTALAEIRVDGPATDLPFLTELIGDERITTGDYDAGLVASLRS